MKVYADRPLRATNQVLGDLLVLAWCAVWVWLGMELHDLVAKLAAPGEQAEEAGRTLQGSLSDAADNVGDVPFAGDALRTPFDEGAGAGRDLADAAVAYQESVRDLAVLTGVLLAAAPIAIVLGLWLPRRIAWIAAASAARRLLARGGDAAADLFALRALARQPLDKLSRTGAGDLMDGWRRQDPAVVSALAETELADLGLGPVRGTPAPHP